MIIFQAVGNDSDAMDANGYANDVTAHSHTLLLWLSTSSCVRKEGKQWNPS